MTEVITLFILLVAGTLINYLTLTYAINKNRILKLRYKYYIKKTFYKYVDSWTEHLVVSM
jgi:hypothetical protein